jgi:hypothetical protein
LKNGDTANPETLKKGEKQERRHVMQDEMSAKDLNDRLALIESMIAEGRRKTESWGWTFVLWGVAYYAAIAWSMWGHTPWAWPVTMTAAAILTVVLVSMKVGHSAGTTMGRAIGSIWTALGISMFLLFLSLGMTGRLADARLFIAVAAAMLGMANATSALVLRWKVQFGSAIIWWAAAVTACFVTETLAGIVFLVAIFLCQIVFGIYGMIREGRAKARRGGVHA